MANKRILILSTHGGYGHVAASSTIISLLSSQYDIDIVYPIKDIRFYGVPSGESFYNFLLAHNYIRTTNWVVRNITFRLFANREEKMVQLVESYLEKNNYDILISVIPFVNQPAAEAARRKGLPFLLVTTDNYLQHWAAFLDKNRHPQIKVTIGSDLPTSKGVLLGAGIPKSAIETVGLPIRPSFLEAKDRAELQRKYGIPKGKKTALLMLGGVGSKKVYAFAKRIIAAELGIHLIVCSGKNKALAKKLQTLEPSGGNSIDVRPFTSAIDELFAVADLVITKAGPGTINEAMVFKLPVLVDASDATLFWERVNVDFVRGKKIGEAILSLDSLPALLQKFLHDPVVKEQVAEAYLAIPPNLFAEKIKPIVDEMCGKVPAFEALAASMSRSFDPSHL